MSIPNDSNFDDLISRLALPLAPAVREDFRRAAQEALAQAPCAGEGLAYRIVGLLQRRYYDPPSDRVAAWDIGGDLRASKLTTRLPLEHGGDQRHVRYRHLKQVG